jgi:N-formylglutamate amidohydrolase
MDAGRAEGTHFSIFEPTARETPVVVEVPHAGLGLVAAALATLRAPVHALGRDADMFVDRLYADAPREGATLLVAHTSRYVVDLNRSEHDVDADAVEGAPASTRASRGLIWRLTGDGEPVLTRRLTCAEVEARLDDVYRPYHRALKAAIDAKLKRFGGAVVLAAHSMPSVSRVPARSGAEAQPARADVVPGSRGRTSADGAYIDLVDAHARNQGWSVRHDEPYKGGFVTSHYGRPQANVHAVQVELARRLYMDEHTLTLRLEPFDAVRRWCRALVAKLGELALP